MINTKTAKRWLAWLGKLMAAAAALYIGQQITFGAVAIRSMLEGTKEQLVIGDFALYLALGILFMAMGVVGAGRLGRSNSRSIDIVYNVVSGMTFLALLVYVIKPVGYLSAPVQLEVYGWYIKPTVSREIFLFLLFLLLWLMSGPRFVDGERQPV